MTKQIQRNVKKPVAVTRKAQPAVKWQFPLKKQNLIWVGIGIGVVIIGYLLMMTGVTDQPAVLDGKWNNPLAVTVAPIVLVIGYCVIIPFGILKKFKDKEANAE